MKWQSALFAVSACASIVVVLQLSIDRSSDARSGYPTAGSVVWSPLQLSETSTSLGVTNWCALPKLAGTALKLPVRENYPTVVQIDDKHAFLYVNGPFKQAVRLYVSIDGGASFVAASLAQNSGGPCSNVLFTGKEFSFFSVFRDNRVWSANTSRVAVAVTRLLLRSSCVVVTSKPAKLTLSEFDLLPFKAAATPGAVDRGSLLYGSYDGVSWFSPPAGTRNPDTPAGPPAPRLSYNDGYWNMFWDARRRRYVVVFRYNYDFGARSVQVSMTSNESFTSWLPPVPANLAIPQPLGRWQEVYSIALFNGLFGVPEQDLRMYDGLALRMLRDGKVLDSAWAREVQKVDGMDLVPVRSTDGGLSWDFPCGNTANDTWLNLDNVPGARPTAKGRYAVFAARGAMIAHQETSFYVQSSAHDKFHLLRYVIDWQRRFGVRAGNSIETLTTPSFTVDAPYLFANFIALNTAKSLLRIGILDSDTLESIRGFDLRHASPFSNHSSAKHCACWKAQCSVKMLIGQRVRLSVEFREMVLFDLITASRS